VYTATIAVEGGDEAYILGNNIDDNDAGQAFYSASANTWYNWIGLTTAMRLNTNPNVASIAENSYVSGVHIYPNPSSDNLNIRFTAKEDLNVIVNVIAMDGKTVLTENTSAIASNNSKITLNVDGLSAGIYTVQLISENSALTYKVAIN